MKIKSISFRTIAFYFLLVIIMSQGVELYAQSIHINGNQSTYQLMDRISVLNGSTDDIHKSNQHIGRRAILDFYRKIYGQLENNVDKSRIESFVINNQEYLEKTGKGSTAHIQYVDSSNLFYTIEKTKNDNIFHKRSATPILKYFYRSPGKFYEIDKKYFKLTVNPILNIKVGKEKGTASPVFKNLRGVEISGLIDDKVYFYTNILESQQLFNNYTERWIKDYRAIPGAGFYKVYKSTVSDRLQGWDFLNSQAYVGVKISKSINVEFGHGRHFIGNGIRSLLLSDHSNNYFYLKFNTKIWKFNYQNVFAELNAFSSRTVPGGDQLIPKKYFAAHYLSYKPWKNVEIGLFETVIFSRENHFEFQYLNPIILYRTVEQLVGSPDNSMLGMNANIDLFKHVSIYGQFVLDEFKLSEIKASSGWWANKFGFQAGIKYFNVLNINQLDLQVEYNTVRPYTYSHGRKFQDYKYALSSYSNYNQPLAHPRGANFKEFLVSLRYRPIAKLLLQARYMNTLYGEDNTGKNWGTNILLLNSTREQPLGNFIGQGAKTTIAMVSFDASYEILHNYYIDFRYLYRNQTSAIDSKSILTNYIGGGIRVNISQLNYDY